MTSSRIPRPHHLRSLRPPTMVKRPSLELPFSLVCPARPSIRSRPSAPRNGKTGAPTTLGLRTTASNSSLVGASCLVQMVRILSFTHLGVDSSFLAMEYFSFDSVDLLSLPFYAMENPCIPTMPCRAYRWEDLERLACRKEAALRGVPHALAPPGDETEEAVIDAGRPLYNARWASSCTRSMIQVDHDSQSGISRR